MSEMDEHVARALCREIGVPEDSLVDEGRYSLGHSMDNLKPAWVTQLPKARAAIAAMRWPTPEMIEAGEAVEEESPLIVWQAMNDAALIGPVNKTNDDKWDKR